MATAVEPGSQPQTPSAPMSLPLASLIGAVYIVAAIAIVLFAIPNVWATSVEPAIKDLTLTGLPCPQLKGSATNSASCPTNPACTS